MESIYKCVLCYDPESLWKTLSVRVKVVVMVRVRAGMDGWGLWSKCFFTSSILLDSTENPERFKRTWKGTCCITMRRLGA